jgi:aminopeptidase N
VVHQFFGNAVLIDFWSHLWLIEGFTTFFEYQLAGNLYPEWRERDLFNLNRLQTAFREDESNTAPAITENVETIDEIVGVFGAIAYEKAGSVLRMFEKAIGAENFRDCLRNYLKVNNHKTVVSSHFYSTFNEVLMKKTFTDFDFVEAFKTWELQKGFPILHVKFNKQEKQFHLTQKRFFIDSELTDDANSKWFIPINFATSENQNFNDEKFTDFFEPEVDEKIISIEKEPEWFVFNKQQIGFYRVNYDLENWKNLIQILNSENFNQIHVLNRAQLIDDSLSFAKAGLIDYDVAAEVLMYLRQETDYVPWAAALSHLGHIYEVFGGRNENFNVRLKQKICKTSSMT